jgi:hypothetical protein
MKKFYSNAILIVKKSGHLCVKWVRTKTRRAYHLAQSRNKFHLVFGDLPFYLTVHDGAWHIIDHSGVQEVWNYFSFPYSEAAPGDFGQSGGG